jgi:thiol-disulfide isomerase/thioredoxin
MSQENRCDTTHFTRRLPLPIAVLACGGIALATFVGCGNSEPAESTVVTPPGPAGETESPAKSADPAAPGGLEMPAGEVPQDSSSGTADPEQGGLEMPAGSSVPVDSGASRNIQYGTWEEIQKQVQSTGKVTVVDLWSLSCEPCLKEFPGLVRLHQSFGDTVQCVAIDMDFDGRKTRPPEYYEDRVAAFIESVGAPFTTYISQTPSDEIYAATKLDSIPAVLIYDADGQLVKVFADAGETVGFTYDKDVIPFVTKLTS